MKSAVNVCLCQAKTDKVKHIEVDSANIEERYILR